MMGPTYLLHRVLDSAACIYFFMEPQQFQSFLTSVQKDKGAGADHVHVAN